MLLELLPHIELLPFSAQPFEFLEAFVLQLATAHMRFALRTAVEPLPASHAEDRTDAIWR